MMTNETAAAFGLAEESINRARARGWTIPARCDETQALYREAFKLAKSGPPELPEMTTPARLEKALRDYATRKGQHEAFIEAAEAAVDYAARSVIVAFRQQLPTWIDTLAGSFTTTTSQFLQAYAVAPGAQLTGYESEEQVQAFMTARRCAGELDSMLHDRVALGLSVAEAHAHRFLLWMAVEPPREAEPDQLRRITELFQDYTGRDFHNQTSLERWAHLAAVAELSLPALGEVATRVERWDRVRGQAAAGGPQMTPQGQEARRADETQHLAVLAQRRAEIEKERADNTARVHRERQLAANR